MEFYESEAKFSYKIQHRRYDYNRMYDCNCEYKISAIKKDEVPAEILPMTIHLSTLCSLVQKNKQIPSVYADGEHPIF